MPSYYMIVQYLPDPVIDEKINIGVVVLGDGKVRAKFLEDWRRVKNFCLGNEIEVEFLCKFAEYIAGNQLSWPELTDGDKIETITEDLILKAQENWIHSVQFTEPRHSMRKPDELLSFIASKFLRQPIKSHKRSRDRRIVASIAAERLGEALKRKIGPKGRELLKRNYNIPGRLEKHKFDVSVVNGGVYFAAQGISFEISDEKDISKDITSMAWALDDVRKRHDQLPLAIIALPPRKKEVHYQYKRALDLCAYFGAELVVEEKIHDWASKMVSIVPSPGDLNI